MLFQDSQTNKVYFSTLLPKNYPIFSKKLFLLLNQHNVNYELVSNTKDIWMRDYMPIQRNDGKFIRYIHKPDYLIGYSNIKTKPKKATHFLDSKSIIDIELNLDGGNIVRDKNKIICTEKIFKANPNYSEQEVKDILKLSLDVSEVIIIPEQPFDMMGHSDGLVRFIDENRVMITPYKEEDREFEKELVSSLLKYKLEIFILPPKGYFKEKDGAEWIPYINYMQVGNLILLPIIGTQADDDVLTFFKKHFPYCIIEWIDAIKIIEQGGALNCISWNIYEDENSDDK